MSLNRGPWRRPPRGALVLALLGLPLASLAPASAASASASRVAVPGGASALVRVGTAPTVPPTAVATGALRASRSVELGLSLRPRDPAGLAAYAAGVSTPGSPEYHRYLTPATFAARFGPTKAEVAAVTAAMRRAGLAVGKISANRLLLPVRGSASGIETAFHTSLAGYRLASGERGWAATSAPRLAAATARDVQSVIGLDDLAVPQSQLRFAPATRKVPVPSSTVSPHVLGRVPAGSPRACPAAAQDALTGGGWTDEQIANAYGLEGLYARGDRGAGQTIALFELEPFLPSDVSVFDRCFFSRSHVSRISTIPVDGFNLVGPGSGESILDIENLEALAPDAKILVYEAPNTTFGGIDEYNAMVSEDRANIISSSWGECESALETGAPGAQQLENTIFEEAAAQGQTVVSAAGDTGSDDCAGTPFSSTTAVRPYLSVEDPASQPFVLGVGGTSLLTDSNPPSQTVWNHGSDWGGGGGGVSSTWPMPSWQAKSLVPGIATSGGREVPDVSAAADQWRGITVYSKGFAASGGGSSRPGASFRVPAGWTTIGGTSSAAPIWAAVLAEIAASGGACSTLPVTPGGRDLGFVAPELYAIAASPSSYASSFSKVTRGNNDVFGLGLGYSAGPGYSRAAGLGSPIVTDARGRGGLDATLCSEAAGSLGGVARPTVTSVSPPSGPAGGGGSATITGSGFPAGDTGGVQVDFGAAAATVESVTSNAITVQVPAPAIAAGTPSTSLAGRVEVTVTVRTGSSDATSLPSVASAYEYLASGSGATVPSVSGIGPSGGNVAGGSTVTVYGTGFSSGGTPTVTFGGVAAGNVVVHSDSELTATVPAESSSTSCASGAGFDASAACQVQVVVSNANGSSATSTILPAISGSIVFNPQGVVVPTPETEVAPAASEYDYAPTPVITSITPDPADSSGSTPVTITGSGFSFDTLEWVNFGPPSSSASEQVRISSITPNQITIVPPQGSGASSGARSVLKGGVSVQTAGGLSNVYRFSFAGVPDVRALGSLGGVATGGTQLVVHGSGFADVTSVAFSSEVSASGYGASQSTVLRHVSDDELVVTTPADLPGPVDVEPCTPSGCAKPNPQADTFVYYSPGRPTLSIVTPRSGPAKGGTQVEMFGDNLNGAIGVQFGAHSTDLLASLRDFPDGDPYILAADSTPGPAGSTVQVRVLTRSGRAEAVGGGTFHYLPSAPSEPRALKVSIDKTTATLRWAAPASDGGSAVTSYTALAITAGAAPVASTVGSTARSATLAHLAAGRTYLFRVVATNHSFGRGVWNTVGPYAVGYASDGYRLATSTGAVDGFGSLPSLGGTAGTPGASSVVGIAGTSDGTGYWLATASGSVYAFGDAPSLPYAPTATPAVGIAALPTGYGYWVLTSAGKVAAFGRARLYGEPDHGKPLPSTATAIAATPDGAGYYVLTASGTVYGLGNASAGAPLSAPAGVRFVSIAANPDGLGYFVLASDGRVYAVNTSSFGSPAPGSLTGTAVGIAVTADGHGYWVVSSTGAVYAFGDATFEGSVSSASSAGTVVGIATD